MKDHKLLAIDFDGTIAQTFEPSPHGIGVNEAYEQSVIDIFGQEGYALYHELGGLKNRSPSELVESMLRYGNTGELAEKAIAYLEENQSELSRVVPRNKGIPLDFSGASQQAVISELFVRCKLSYLLDQVGTRFPNGDTWPRMCEGFSGFWDRIYSLRQQAVPITTAVISSGHDLFINKSFDMWNVPKPDILVTEDDVRNLPNPSDISLRVKPGPLPLTLAYEKWRSITDSSLGQSEFAAPFLHGDSILYIGDDQIKDGGLAEQNGIQFALYSKEGGSMSTGYNDWYTLENKLRQEYSNYSGRGAERR